MKTLALAALAITLSHSTAAAQASPTLQEYVYTPPAGWSATVHGDVILLRAPAQPTGESCAIGLSGLVPSTGDLASDANAAWARNFADFEVRPTSTFPSAAHVIRGVASQGWEYLIVKRGMALRGSPADPLRAQGLFGFVMVAKLGARVATVFGVSFDPLVSSCFGSALDNVWPRFFSTLRFRSVPGASEHVLAEGMIGAWESYGSSLGSAASIQYVFTPAGRYAELGAMRRVTIDSVWMSTTFGDGAYRLRGNEITLLPDVGRPEVGSLRLERVSEDGGRTWMEILYFLRSAPQLAVNLCGPFPCAPAQPELRLVRRPR